MTVDNLTVIFDGDCGICQASRRAAERRDAHHRLRFVAYQGADLDRIAPGLTREEARRALVVVHPDGRRWHGARAFVAVLRRLPGVWGMMGAVGTLPPVYWLAEPFYRVIARHRAAISRWLGLTQCRIDGPEQSG
jgi:predicted DCC family thiol-disulfide oxidoreductase YuxK